MRKTRSRCNSFPCEGMNQPDSATEMHDCVINNRRIVHIENCQGEQRDIRPRDHNKETTCAVP